MSFSETFIRVAKNVLPMPMTIAILLTFLAMVLAMMLTGPQPGTEDIPYWVQIGSFWEHGFWDLLAFSMQMMLILVLGHVLALTKPADFLIRQVLGFCTTTPKAAAIVTFVTVVTGLLNWGLGLIFGAILARKVGEHAAANRYEINYPIVGAAGYSGMMVWHGGLSGSAPLTVAGENTIVYDEIGIIPLSETLFSPMNLVMIAALLVILPAAMAWLGSRLEPTDIHDLHPHRGAPHREQPPTGAARLDESPWLAWVFGGGILALAVFRLATEGEPGNILNFINFILLGLGIFLFGNLKKYVEAVEDAIVGATGIMLQFPIYAGIAGIIQYSGMIDVISGGITSISNTATYPLYTLVSAAIVNVFVPSGGGQLAVQGPIIVEAAQPLGVSYAKSIMAMSYGDQLTNMMQPFWALPLLGITRLTAQEILPYTLYLMFIGGAIFTVGLLVF